MEQIIKNYRDNDGLRHSFNRLAQQTFGLTFEQWYQNGYWRENYIPYSIVDGGRVVANVSVNITDMYMKGERRHLIQLGTVMTEESCRNRGLIRRLMGEIEADYGAAVDGIYLFANDGVLDFYPRFGFRPAKEYEYERTVTGFTARPSMQPVPMREAAAWKRLEGAIRDSRFGGQLRMAGNSDLIMFYVTQFMQENVYYVPSLDTYAIAELSEGELLLHQVYGPAEVSLEQVMEAFGGGVRRVVLGFTPEETDVLASRGAAGGASGGFTRRERHEEDTTLFVKGAAFDGFEEAGLMFPTLSHA